MLHAKKGDHTRATPERGTADHIRRMEAEGRPVALTVDGGSELVVRDATSYRLLWELVDRLEAIAGIRRGLDEAGRGEAVPLEELDRRLRRKHGLPD